MLPAMGRLSGTVRALPSDGPSTGSPWWRPWPARLATGTCVAAGLACLTNGAVASGLGFLMAALAAAVLWVVPGAASGPTPAGTRLGCQLLERAHRGDPDLYLDLDAVEVEAVYRIDTELYAHLRGGIGQRVDPSTGDRRCIETSDVSLTWRCSCRRTAERLASQLNYWEARGTPLRLLAIKGRCAVLMEDTTNWVTLPELRLAA